MRTIRFLVLGSCLLLLSSGAFGDDDARTAIDRVLDDFHLAAAEADGPRYFGHLTEDAVFLGTDASERWPKAAFQAFAKPYFDEGKGWTYVSRERHVDVESGGGLAWFDELLDNEAFGTCRGSGVLRREGERWRIAQYNLTFPVPNALAREVMGRIRAHARGATRATTLYVVAAGERDCEADPVGRIAHLLRSAALDTIYATSASPTQDIAKPLAARLGLETHSEDTAEELASALTASPTVGAALVVLPRTALPDVLEGLGVKDVGPHADETDAIFVITLVPGSTPLVTRLHY